MANLQKREMIILGVMGIAILFGAYSLFSPDPKAGRVDNLTASRDELNTFINTLNEGIQKEANNHGSLVFASAKRVWTPDPFLENSSYKQWTQSKKAAMAKHVAAVATEAPPAVKKIEFHYTGYLEAGGKKMAIVDGSEYQEGEKLEMKDYLLRSATPTGIIIENTATGARQSVLLDEEEGVNELRK